MLTIMIIEPLGPKRDFLGPHEIAVYKDIMDGVFNYPSITSLSQFSMNFTSLIAK